MPSFVYDNTALPSAKSNAVSVPASASETNYFQGSDYNAIKTALEDCRAAIFKGGGRLAPQAAIPVAGTYAVGEIVMNSVPVEGSNIGWVCVTAGTPGSWLEFGVISVDVLNGGGGGGGGASDILEPERLHGTNKAELALYPDLIAGGRKAQFGFITASATHLTVKNEKTNGNVVLTPNGAGKVHVDAGAGLDIPGAGKYVAAAIANFDSYSTYSGSVSGTNIPINTEEVRITGVDEARCAFYPDGSGSGRKGFLGFLAAAVNVLELRNEKASGGDIKLVPGSGGKMVFNGTLGVKSINVFTTTDNWNGAGTNSGVNFDYTVSGVAVGDMVLAVFNSSLTAAGQQISGLVTATNTVNVTWRNYSGSSQDPASGTITIIWADIT